MTAPLVDITRTCGSDGDEIHAEQVMRLARSLPGYFSPAGLETLTRDIAHGTDVYLAWRNGDAFAFAVVRNSARGVAEPAWIGVPPIATVTASAGA